MSANLSADYGKLVLHDPPPISFANGFVATEVDCISLHQRRIELMLSNNLAKVIANLGATIVPVCRLGR